MRPSQARDKNSPSTPKTADLYDSLHRRFGWQVPEHFNMAQVCMRRWAGQAASATRTAVIACAPGQPERRHSYGELMDQANRLSNALAALGVQRGDRVAIVLPQRFETAVAYMAVLQMGSNTGCTTARRWSRSATSLRWARCSACATTAPCCAR
jgi:acetyl-CoA synthetase